MRGEESGVLGFESGEINVERERFGAGRRGVSFFEVFLWLFGMVWFFAGILFLSGICLLMVVS